METVKAPITGNEIFDKMLSPELNALSSFYKAFNGSDLYMMAQCWLNTDESSMDNPIGGIRRGWDDILEGYKKLFGGKARVKVEFFDYSIHQSEDMFVAVGRERGHFGTKGSERTVAIRTTRIFIKRAGAWRQLHHHGSIDEPDLLNAYQHAFE